MKQWISSASVITGGEIFSTVQPTMMSGDDVYQICILHPYYSYNSFIDGYQSLWDLVYLPTFTILQKQPSITAYYTKNERNVNRTVLPRLFQSVKE